MKSIFTQNLSLRSLFPQLPTTTTTVYYVSDGSYWELGAMLSVFSMD
ncbi:MAG: hypothetical protein SXA11_07490 [Cyanobacteriota bacterium]|nr:hypothetical protein [Cyanobacteriota bacterium]